MRTTVSGRRSLLISLLLSALAVLIVLPLSARQSKSAKSAAGGQTTSHRNALVASQGAKSDPSQVGSWTAPVNLGVTSIHAALLHTGKVLAWWYPQGDNVNSPAKLYDTVTGKTKDVTVPFPGDFFCSGHTILADGRVLVTGGLLGNPHPGVPDDGITATAIFDPGSETWSQGTPMNLARWYPTDIELPSGQTLTLTGKNEHAFIDLPMEQYDPATEAWTLLPSSANLPQQSSDTYLKMKLLTNGKIFMAGSDADSYTFDPSTNRWALTATMKFGNRYHGAAVILPGLTKVFAAGGTANHAGGSPTATAEVIDFSAPTPQWSFVSPMNIPRYNSNLVILADGTLLEVGGAQTERYGTPVMIPELYDPNIDTWTEMAAQTDSRPYHSTALLLPDGTVWSAGSDDPTKKIAGHSYEIFSPPYLFKGARPSITSAPTSITYNQKFTVTTPDAASVTKVSLVRPGSTTHDNDFDQRYVVLDVKHGTGKLSVTAPPNANYAPPGWYMLVLVNSSGVPSVMPFLQLM